MYNHVLIKPNEYRYVGLANYARLLHDDVFWLSLENSFFWVFGSVSLQFLGGFAAALLLHESFRGRALVRTITLLPWIIPGVVVALIWEFIYQPNYGLLNDILNRTGLMTERVAWLSSPSLAMPAVIATNVWRGVPFFAIMVAIQPEMGGIYTFKSFLVIVLGGAGNYPGALLGGLLLGLIEQLSSLFFTTQINEAVAYILLVLVLLIRPTGLLKGRV